MITFNKVANKSQQSFFSRGSSQKQVNLDIRLNVDMDSGKIKLTVPGESRPNASKSPVRTVVNQFKPTTTSTQPGLFGQNSSAYSASSISHKSQPSSLSSHDLLKVPLPPPKDIYCVLCKRSYQSHQLDYHIKLHRDGQNKGTSEQKVSGFSRKQTPYFAQLAQETPQQGATQQRVTPQVSAQQATQQAPAQQLIMHASPQKTTMQQTPTFTQIRNAQSIHHSHSSAKSLSVASKSLSQQNISIASRSSQQPRQILMTNGSFNNLQGSLLQYSQKSVSIPSIQNMTPQLPQLRTLTNKSNSQALQNSGREEEKNMRISKDSYGLSNIQQRASEMSMNPTVVKPDQVYRSQAIIEPEVELSERERAAQSQPDPTIMDRLSDSRADILWQSMVYGDYKYDRLKRPWQQTPDVLASNQSKQISNSSNGRAKMPKNLFAVEMAIDQKLQNSKKQGQF